MFNKISFKKSFYCITSSIIIASLFLLLTQCSNDKPTDPDVDLQPRSEIELIELPGSINGSEITGDGLKIYSAWDTGRVVSDSGKFDIKVSNEGAQLTFALDKNDRIRGLCTSTPDATSKTLEFLEFDSKSTALSLLLLTPGILAIDPDTVTVRKQQIESLPSFTSAVDLLRSKMKTLPIDECLQDSGLVSAFTTVVEDWLGSQATQKSELSSESAESEFGLDITSLTSTTGETEISIFNDAFRYVNVFARDFDINGQAISDPKVIAHPMSGGIPVSLGSIFTGAAGRPTMKSNIAKFGVQGNCDSGTPLFTKREFWFIGPGFGNSVDQPPDNMDKSITYPTLATIVNYILFPIVDIISGVAGLIDVYNDIVKFVNELKTAIDLTKLIAAVDQGDIRGVLIQLIDMVDRALDYLANSTLDFLSNPRDVKAVKAASKLIKTTSTLFATYNGFVVFKNLATTPRNFKMEVTAEDIVTSAKITINSPVRNIEGETLSLTARAFAGQKELTGIIDVWDWSADPPGQVEITQNQNAGNLASIKLTGTGQVSITAREGSWCTQDSRDIDVHKLDSVHITGDSCLAIERSMTLVCQAYSGDNAVTISDDRWEWRLVNSDSPVFMLPSKNKSTLTGNTAGTAVISVKDQVTGKSAYHTVSVGPCAAGITITTEKERLKVNDNTVVWADVIGLDGLPTDIPADQWIWTIKDPDIAIIEEYFPGNKSISVRALEPGSTRIILTVPNTEFKDSVKLRVVPEALIPLEVGKYWVWGFLDENEIADPTQGFRKQEIAYDFGDGTFRVDMYSSETNSPDGPWYYNYFYTTYIEPDGDIYIKYHSPNGPCTDCWERLIYPMEVGGIVKSLDTLITVPAGTFSCIYLYYGDCPNNFQRSRFYAPGIGVVKEEYIIFDQGSCVSQYYWVLYSTNFSQ